LGSNFLFMPTTTGPTEIANLALDKIGSQAINSLLGTDPSSLACNRNFVPACIEVARAGRWNCIMTPAVLTAVVQPPVPGNPVPTPAPPWAPNTAYIANTFLTYGGYYYQVAFSYTSSNNFVNDLTAGALIQTNQQTNQPFFWGCDSAPFPSGWNFAYALPTDFQLLVTLNDHTAPGWSWCGEGQADYEIMGLTLYCNESQAVIQYVQNQPDTTRFDSLFTDCVAWLLASKISTALRQDGGQMEISLLAGYKEALKLARTKNAGERRSRRFNLIKSSKFNAARFYGVNG
jgi:hypothetical protein